MVSFSTYAKALLQLGSINILYVRCKWKKCLCACMCETESLHVSLIRLLSFAVCSSLSCPVQTLRRSLPPPTLHTVDRHTCPPQQVCGSVSRHCCSGHKQTDRVHTVAQTAPEPNSGWFSYSLMDRYRKSLTTGVCVCQLPGHQWNCQMIQGQGGHGRLPQHCCPVCPLQRATATVLFNSRATLHPSFFNAKTCWKR